jgi:nitroreductase
MGDKTQLLSFVLAAKFKSKGAICLGILVATLANHFLAGYVGVLLSKLVAPGILMWIIAIAFLAFGAWALKPDTFEQKRELGKRGVFLTTTVAFFLSQNVYLYCASEGLATVVRGLIDRPALEKTMKLRPEQKVILAQSVGYPKR